MLTSNPIQNWTQDDQTVRLKLDLGVEYGSDISRAQQAMIRACRRADERILSEPGPKALVVGAGASSIDMQLRFWISDPEGGIRNVLSAVFVEVFEEFEAEGIGIPFPQMDIALVGRDNYKYDNGNVR